MGSRAVVWTCIVTMDDATSDDLLTVFFVDSK